MPSALELAANGIVVSLETERDQRGLVERKSMQLTNFAEAMMNAYGADGLRGKITDNDNRLRAKKETGLLVIAIPFTDRPNTDGQRVNVYLSEASEGGVLSGYTLEMGVPSLHEVTTAFYFRKDPRDSRLTPTVKNWNNQYADMHDLIVAEQLLQALHLKLQGEKEGVCKGDEPVVHIYDPILAKVLTKLDGNLGWPDQWLLFDSLLSADTPVPEDWGDVDPLLHFFPSKVEAPSAEPELGRVIIDTSSHPTQVVFQRTPSL